MKALTGFRNARFIRRLFRWSLGLGLAAGRLEGQQLRVVVTEPTSGPAVGALAVLTDGRGTVVTRAITDEVGRARLTAPAGDYRLSLVRPGFVDTTMAVSIGPESDTVSIRAPGGRPDFPALLQRLPTSCQTPGVPAALAVPWSQAKAALAVVAAGEELEAATLSITTFERDLSPGAKREAEQGSTILAPGNVPPNVDPASERDGYLRRSDSAAWFAPDVRSFQNAEFEAGHCFGWTTGAGERDGLFGLEFAPAAATPALLAGTFWLDPKTRELRVIDYRFTGLPADWRPDRIGGSIELHRSPRGLWVTRFWYQRTARLKLATDRKKDRLIGYHEVGAEVTAVDPTVDTTDRIATARAIARNRAEARGRYARMAGTVIDSAGTTLPDADVALLGSELETRSNEKGSFVLTGLPLGVQIVRVRKIGYKAKFVPLRLSAGQEWTGTITMARLPVTLEDIVVVGKYGKPEKYANTGKYDGFYRRRAARVGKFMTREEIDRVNTSRIADLIKGIPGVMTSFNPVAGRDGVEFSGCPSNVGVWVDGQRLSGEPGELLPLITARDIETLEVYQREGLIPPEFQDGSCAAIVMWTR